MLETTEIEIHDNQPEHISITVSIGLSLGQGAKINLHDLLKKAVFSLYQAKAVVETKLSFMLSPNSH
jgi:GGDEF domain-containing protein